MRQSATIRQACLFLAWSVALVSLLATLYASEVLGWPVCHLCWYQRICWYPLAIILGIAAYDNNASIVRYVLPLPVIATIFAVYQYLEQMIPGFGPVHLCGIGPSCSNIHLQWLGFITLPLLSAIAAITMLLLLLYAKRN